MVVALDDWTIRVAMAPQNAPRIGVAAAFARTVRSADPASAFSPSVMTVMPSRNRPTPPRMEIAVDILAPNLKSFVRSPDRHLQSLIVRPGWLRLASKLRARRGQLFFRFGIDRWKRELQLFNGGHDGGGNKKSSKPFVVGGHDVPRSMLRSRRADGLLESRHIVGPKFPLVNIRGRKLPVFFRLVEPLHEAVLLLFTRHVEEEFENAGALAAKVVFEICDIGKPLVPDVFANELWRQVLALEYLLMHTTDEDLFVIRAVENSYASAFREALGVAPHEVVIEVFRRWLLEREDLTTLRIYTGHYVFDRSILAGCIHRLKYKQQGPAVLRIEDFLLLSEPDIAALKELRRFPFVHFQSAGIARIVIFQPESLAFGNPERFYVFLDLIQDFLSRHRAISLWPDTQCIVEIPKEVSS